MEEYTITDFTVISTWEEFTRQCEEYIQALHHHRNTTPTRTLSFRGYPLSLYHIQHLPRIASISGLGNLGIDVQRERTAHYAYVGRAFDSIAAADGGEFLLLRSEEAVLSLASARLVLSSIAMALQPMESPMPVFVEYEEGLLMGIDGGRLRRFSLSVSEANVVLEGNEPGQWLRPIVSRHFAGVPFRSLKSKLCFTMLFQARRSHAASMHLLSAKAGGIDLQWGVYDNTINSLQLQMMIPQLEPGKAFAGMLPDPWEAPIWLLSLQQVFPFPSTRSMLCDVVRRLAELLRIASQPPSTENATIHNKATMHSLYLAEPGGSLEPERTLMANMIKGSRSEDPLSKLALILLWALQRSEGEIRGRLARLWMAFISLLQASWNELDPSLLSTVSNEHVSSLESHLWLLRLCMEREKSYSAIPDVPPRTSYDLSSRASEIFDAWADQQQQQQRRERTSMSSSYLFVVARRLSRLNLVRRKSSLAVDGADKDANDNDNQNKGKDKSEDEEDEEEDEEEFFDAIEQVSTVEAAQVKEILADLRQLSAHADDEPAKRGQKERLGDLRMVETGEPLYVPHTQESTPILDHAHEEPAPSVQTAQLLSDMQAFKAANPGAVFADFVRWHSPRDWHPTGHLSARMSAPNNLWTQLWDACHALPVSMQPLLYDHRREAARVISVLENVSLAEFFSWLLLAGMRCIADTINQLARDYDQPGIHLRVPELIDADALEAFLATLHSAEHHLSLTRDLHSLLPSLPETEELLRGDVTLVGDDVQRGHLRRLFGASTIEQLELSMSLNASTAPGRAEDLCGRRAEDLCGRRTEELYAGRTEELYAGRTEELYVRILARQHVEIALVTSGSGLE